MVNDSSLESAPDCSRALRRGHTVVADLESQRTEGPTVETHEHAGAAVTETAGIVCRYRSKRLAQLDVENGYGRELASTQLRFAVVTTSNRAVPAHPPPKHATSVSAGSWSGLSWVADAIMATAANRGSDASRWPARARRGRVRMRTGHRLLRKVRVVDSQP
jgi:hypothetical protein